MLGGYEFTERCTGFIGYAHGKRRDDSLPNWDAYAGGMYRFDDAALTIEYHRGRGGWQRAAGDINWTSWVASVSTRF